MVGKELTELWMVQNTATDKHSYSFYSVPCTTNAAFLKCCQVERSTFKKWFSKKKKVSKPMNSVPLICTPSSSLKGRMCPVWTSCYTAQTILCWPELKPPWTMLTQIAVWRIDLQGSHRGKIKMRSFWHVLFSSYWISTGVKCFENEDCFHDQDYHSGSHAKPYNVVHNTLNWFII